MNVYMVWTESLCPDGWRPDYYLFVAAKSHSGAKYEYACFGGWEFEYFSKQPEGFAMHAVLVEKDAPYDGTGEIWDYEEVCGVDLILSGVLTPIWMSHEFTADNEYDYRRWNGFRSASRRELEVQS